jgi:hypothetical protein
MKNDEALTKAYRVFQGDEDDALLRLAILKERAITGHTSRRISAR